MKNLKLIFMTFILIIAGYPSFVLAQQGGQGGAPSQVNLFYSKVLPKSIDYIDEIFSLWGVRYSTPMSADASSYAEFALVNADDDLVDWTGVSASVRMDAPIETLVGIAFAGLDYNFYQGEGGEEESDLGFHAGGGVLAHIGGNAHFRIDMKFLSKPGTTLAFGMGFVADF